MIKSEYRIVVFRRPTIAEDPEGVWIDEFGRDTWRAWN